MKKTKQLQILKMLLYAGVFYFSGVAVVHALGVKIPGLYVFYNVPSYAYQDRIISFLAFGWAAIFLQTVIRMDPGLIKLILTIGLVAIVALLLNVAVTDFSLLDPKINPVDFLWIIGALIVYWLGLIIHSRELIWSKALEGD